MKKIQELKTKGEVREYLATKYDITDIYTQTALFGFQQIASLYPASAPAPRRMLQALEIFSMMTKAQREKKLASLHPEVLRLSQAAKSNVLRWREKKSRKTRKKPSELPGEYPQEIVLA